MSANEWTEWYLTPRGWERGSSKTNFAPIALVRRPTDWLVMSCYSEFLGTSIANDVDVRVEWRGEDAEPIVRLLTKHGAAPRHL